jgi:lipoprotein-releasing system permease protein
MCELYLIRNSSKILGQPKNYITDIQLNLYDKEMAPAVAQEFHKAFNLDAMDYQTANSQFETEVQSEVLYPFGWLDCVLLAGFGIYNNPEHDDI